MKGERKEMGIFTSKKEKSFGRNFAEFSDSIFSDESSNVAILRQDFVSAMEEEDFALLTTNNYFRVMLLEDSGLLFEFSDSPKGEDSSKIYLSREDSILLFDELVAIREGIWHNITLEDKVNNYTISIIRSQSDVCTFDVSVAGKLIAKVTGTYGVLQKLMYYMLYARYYKR